MGQVLCLSKILPRGVIDTEMWDMHTYIMLELLTSNANTCSNDTSYLHIFCSRQLQIALALMLEGTEKASVLLPRLRGSFLASN